MYFNQIGETEIHESLMMPNTQNLRGRQRMYYMHTHARPLTHRPDPVRQTVFHHMLTPGQAKHVI